MRDIQTYIVTKNNKILRVYRTTQGQDGILKSLQYEKIYDYDSIEKVTNEYEGVSGMDVREIDTQGKVRPEEERIIEGLIPPPKGKKVLHGAVVDKTTLEKIRDGEIEIGSHEVYDEATDTIRPKTREEMFSPEELQRMEEEQLIQEEMRKIAIERLVAAGKIAPRDKLKK